MRTKAPSLRITKWLNRRIPLEGESSSCANAQFKVGFDIRQSFYQPNRDDYQSLLQRQFDLMSILNSCTCTRKRENSKWKNNKNGTIQAHAPSPQRISHPCLHQIIKEPTGLAFFF